MDTNNLDFSELELVSIRGSYPSPPRLKTELAARLQAAPNGIFGVAGTG
jgi:hypothetical protein